jgi:radical SAM protein with 4Fe4S-binding SPASM domain
MGRAEGMSPSVDVAMPGNRLGRTAPSPRVGLYALAQRRAIPLRVVWEITKRCNLRCYHCYVARPGEELPTARALAIVGELAEAGCLGVTLTGGEVGLRTDFLELAMAIKRQRMQLTVFTNGTVLDDSALRCLAELGSLQVAVSLYGATAASHDRVTGVSGSFDRTLASVRLLRTLGVSCRVHGVLLRDTIAEFFAVADLAEGLGCEWRFDPSVTPTQEGGLAVLEHRVRAKDLRDLLLSPRLAGKTKEYAAGHGDGTRGGKSLGNCGAGFVSAYIAADGDVFGCMGLSPAFGNLVEHSFARAWHGPTAEAHRERMQRPLVECSACDMSGFCTTRCPRMAAVEDGELSGPSARACEIARAVQDWHEELRNQG